LSARNVNLGERAAALSKALIRAFLFFLLYRLVTSNISTSTSCHSPHSMASFASEPSDPFWTSQFQFSRIMPSIPVSSIQSSIDYYTTKLPFRLYGRDGENHCWLGTHDRPADGTRGGNVNFYLRLVGFQGPRQPVTDEKLGQGKIYIRLGGGQDEEKVREENVKKLHRILEQKEAKVQAVQRMPWGQYQFVVLDLDDNQVVFYA